MPERDYAYEALAEVTNTDMNVGRGQLNAALKLIREQADELTDSYLLSCEIHERAKMYRRVFPEVALTPTALAKHWQRVEAETTKVRGVNIHAGVSAPLPPLNEQRLEELNKLKAKLWG